MLCPRCVKVILVIFRRFLNFGLFFGPFLGTLVENSKHKRVAPGNFFNFPIKKNPNNNALEIEGVIFLLIPETWGAALVGKCWLFLLCKKVNHWWTSVVWYFISYMFKFSTDHSFGNMKVFAKNANPKEDPKEGCKGVRVGSHTFHSGVGHSVWRLRGKGYDTLFQSSLEKLFFR